MGFRPTHESHFTLMQREKRTQFSFIQHKLTLSVRFASPDSEIIFRAKVSAYIVRELLIE